MFTQHPYRCRLDWGRHGTRQAAARGDILVIVDTLSFSTAVTTAVHHGGTIYPCSMNDDPAELARRLDGEVAVRRQDVPAKGRFSLSPITLQQATPGTRILLASPNGATCSQYAQQVPFLFVGTLINARAVANVVASLLEKHTLSVTVIACGERWRTPSEDGELRIAVEDYLGAGAILSDLPYEKSPEASICEGAFVQTKDRLKELLWDCGSGRELREIGYENDVIHAAQLDGYQDVPVMRDGWLGLWS